MTDSNWSFAVEAAKKQLEREKRTRRFLFSLVVLFLSLLGVLAALSSGCAALDSVAKAVKDGADAYQNTPGIPSFIGSLGPIGVVVNNVVAAAGLLAGAYGAVRGTKKAHGAYKARKAARASGH